MKVLVLYRPNSEHGRLIDDFIRDFKSRTTDGQFEVLNVDSRDGGAMVSLYDVMTYPAILVLQTDGYLQKSWEGDSLPLVDEVMGYLRA